MGSQQLCTKFLGQLRIVDVAALQFDHCNAVDKRPTEMCGGRFIHDEVSEKHHEPERRRTTITRDGNVNNYLARSRKVFTNGCCFSLLTGQKRSLKIDGQLGLPKD